MRGDSKKNRPLFWPRSKKNTTPILSSGLNRGPLPSGTAHQAAATSHARADVSSGRAVPAGHGLFRRGGDDGDHHGYGFGRTTRHRATPVGAEDATPRG